MNRYEKEVQQSLLDSEAAAIKELEKQYAAALKDINEKVKGFQADIDLLDEALSQDGLDDATRALLQSQKRSKIYQQQYQKALQGQISGILDKMHGDNFATIDKYLHGCYETGYVGTMYDLAGQGIPIIAPIDQAAAVKAILTDSKVSGGLYNRLGVDVAKLKKTITQEISRGIASGLLYRDIARNISNSSKAPLSRAKTIMRTEGHRIQNSAARDAAEEAKRHGADIVKVWDATLDGRTRDSHRRVDGEIRELNEKFSNGLDRPGDPAGGAAEVVNCRCLEIHKPRWDAEGGFLKRDNVTGEILSFESPKDYAEFKEKYWSKENLEYMQKTAELENKYGTTNYEKLLDKMSDKEFEQFKKLEDASPMWKASDIPMTAEEQKAYLEKFLRDKNQTGTSKTVTIGGVDVTVTKKPFGFNDGRGGVKKTVDAVVYETQEGTQFVFPKSYNKNQQQMTAEQALSLWSQVPDGIRQQAQKTIQFVDYYNPRDTYWRKTYKNFGHSYATGGQTITFYRYDYPHDDAYVIRTYCHEAGHFIDTNRGTNGKFSAESLWTKAMADDIVVSGKKSCTAYGENSAAEDFAESMAEYVKDKTGFEKDFPNRAAILATIISI